MEHKIISKRISTQYAQLTERVQNKIISKLERFPLTQKLALQWKKSQVDTYIISFPKCGRTWLRLMISYAILRHFDLMKKDQKSKALLHLEKSSQLHPSIPKIKLEHDDDAFFKSPEELTRSKTEYKYTKVIFLARDPRDVVVSTYYHKVKRRNFMPQDKSKLKYASYSGDISEFLRENTGSFATLLEYYKIWEKNQSTPKEFLLIRYEDLSLDPKIQLRRILDFLGLSTLAAETIEEAVSFASFENMRKMEEKDVFSSVILKPTDRKDYETYKTRRGKVKGYTNDLAAKDIRYLNNEMGKALSRFYGYSSSN